MSERSVILVHVTHDVIAVASAVVAQTMRSVLVISILVFLFTCAI